MKTIAEALDKWARHVLYVLPHQRKKTKPKTIIAPGSLYFSMQKAGNYMAKAQRKIKHDGPTQTNLHLQKARNHLALAIQSSYDEFSVTD